MTDEYFFKTDNAEMKNNVQQTDKKPHYKHYLKINVKFLLWCQKHLYQELSSRMN